MHEGAAHAHEVAELEHEGEHLSGHEHSRQALEHSENAHRLTHTATVGHGIASFGHKEIAALAHEIWEARGCPDGSAEQDWHQAVAQLRAHAHSG
jgi:hypothetical protein